MNYENFDSLIILENHSGMKTKEEIVANWLTRYTKRKLEDFGEYILLTNFNK